MPYQAIKEIYSNAGLFVLPSYHEGLPIVALEAMSYGLQVLVSAIPANMELVSEEDTFKPGNIVELASKIEAFIKSPSGSPPSCLPPQRGGGIRKRVNYSPPAGGSG